MNPGATMRPPASIRGASIGRCGSTAAIRSPWMATSARKAGRPVPSTTCPLATIRSRVGSASTAEARSFAQVPDGEETLLVGSQVVGSLAAAGAPGVALAVMTVAAVHEVVPDAVLPAVEIGVLGTEVALENFASPARAGLFGPLGLHGIDGAELPLRRAHAAILMHSRCRRHPRRRARGRAAA